MLSRVAVRWAWPAGGSSGKRAASSAAEQWARGDREALLELIGRLRTQVGGDWDRAEELVRGAPAHARGQWTAAEKARLVALVRRRFVVGERQLDWARVGREMGRSPASCHTYYYKHRKLPGPAPVEGWPTTLGPRARRLVQGTGEGSLDLIRAAVAAHTVRGAVAWDAAAAQLDVPLVDAVRLAAALQAYDPDAVPGAERVFPDAWPPAERRRMAEFVAKHFGTGAVDWAVIAAYMGADVGSCVAAHVAANCTGGALRRHGRVGWTASQLQRLAEANADRARFPTMRAIAAYVGGHSAASCSSQWRAIRLGGVHAQVEWSEAERETVRRQLRSASPAERRWRRIHALLPHRTKDQVQALMVHERLWLMNRARRAGAAGEPRTDLTAQSAAYSRWTPDEVARLRHAMATVDPADPHRRPLIGFMVGTRSVAVCMAKAQALGLYKREKQRRGVQ